jgi:HK97 family phage major capsid protein
MGRAEALREQALEAVARGQAIYAACDAAGREPSTSERIEVEAAIRQAEALTAQSRLAYSAGDFGYRPAGREAVFIRDINGQAVPLPGGGSGRGSAGVQVGDVRLLGPKDKFAALVPDGAEGEGLSLGQMISSLVTGRDVGVQFRAAMGIGSAGAGGVLVPAPLSAQLIDLARNQSRCIQAGATTIPMTSSTLKVPRLTGGSAAEFKGENAALAAISDLTFDAVTLQARTVMCIAKLSVELAEDGQDPQGIVERDISAALALAMDYAALRGAVTDPQLGPIGVRYTDGVEVTPTGALFDFNPYAPFSLAVQRIREANLEPTGCIYSPAVAGILDRLTDQVGNPLHAPASWEAMGKFSTNQAAADEAYIADWSRLLIGMRTDIAIEVSRVAGDADGSAFRNLQVWVRAYARMDAVVGKPDAFQVLTEIAEPEPGS